MLNSSSLHTSLGKTAQRDGCVDTVHYVMTPHRRRTNTEHQNLGALWAKGRLCSSSSGARALSYYPCPPRVQSHHASFVRAVFSSPCSFQDMPINLSAGWVDILVSLWWPPLRPLCSLVCGQAHGLLFVC